MSFLGIDFIILSSLWLTLVFAFMFIFRKKLFSFYYKSNDFELFILTLKKYLRKTYPNFNFNFSYVEKLKNEPNPQAKQYALIDNIINQYQTKKFNTNKTSTVPNSKLWPSYVLNSKPCKNKLPEDWIKRKALVYQRDNKTCKRCSKTIAIKDSSIFMINSLTNNGHYYIENLILFCLDCEKIETQKRDETKTIKHLDIKNELYSLVK